MIRNFRAPILMFLMVFTTTALAASDASAQGQGQITTENGSTVILTGSDTGGAGANAFTLFGNTIECTANSYAGTVANGKTEFTITPDYTTCTAGGLPATVTVNGCDYKFHIAGTANGNDNTWTIKQVDLICPPSTPAIEVDVYLGTSHTTKVCTIKIGQQSPTAEDALHLTNTPEGGQTKDDLDLTGTVTGIGVSESGIACGTHSEENAVFHFDLTVKGEDENGISRGITVSTE